MSRRSRSALAAAVAGALALAAAGCGGSDTTTSTVTAATTSTATTTDQITETSAPGAAGTAAEGSGEPAESDQQQVSDAIDAVLSSADSKTVCATTITPTALKNFYGSRTACLNSRAKPTLADSVAISDLHVSGDTATAKAKPKGGLYDGETVVVSAVRGPDGWQIDGLDAKVPVGP